MFNVQIDGYINIGVKRIYIDQKTSNAKNTSVLNYIDYYTI